MTFEPQFEYLPTDMNGGTVQITVTQPDDPAYWLLTSANTHHSVPNLDIFRNDCYICRDPEFAQMGLPLCKPCEACKTGHVPADDVICDNCGADAQELYYARCEAECEANGHQWKDYPASTYPRTRQVNGQWVTEQYTEPACTTCSHCQIVKDVK
jgi:hypothetical protein